MGMNAVITRRIKEEINMGSIAGARVLIETVRSTAIFLTDKEISDIGIILVGALKRMEKEAEDEVLE